MQRDKSVELHRHMHLFRASTHKQEQQIRLVVSCGVGNSEFVLVGKHWRRRGSGFVSIIITYNVWTLLTIWQAAGWIQQKQPGVYQSWFSFFSFGQKSDERTDLLWNVGWQDEIICTWRNTRAKGDPNWMDHGPGFGGCMVHWISYHTN